MIRGFKNRLTQRVFEREFTKKLAPELQRQALRKLLVLDAAETLDDLRVPPGNRLEPLYGSRKDQHSIRINRQWRICFRWTSSGPDDVEIADYH